MKWHEVLVHKNVLRDLREALGGAEPYILHDNVRSHTTAAVTDFLSRWQWEILEHPSYLPDVSLWDYDLFAIVKEPLPGTRYNIRDELIRAIGRSKRNVYTDGGTDDVRHLPKI